MSVTTTATPPTTQVQEFGRRLRAAREARGLTTRHAAIAAASSIQHLKRLEAREQSSPTLETVWRFAAAYQVSPAWLAVGDPDDVPKPKPFHFDPATVRMAFARRVRFARETRELSTRALARAAGIDQANVSMLETGVSGTSLRFASLYAEALDVPLAWLLDPSEEIRPWEA